MSTMNKKMFWLTPLIASIIQLVLSAIVYFVYEMLFPPKQPDPRAEVIFVLFVFFGHGAIETAIGYLVSWCYTKISKNRNIILILYAILFCAFSISMGLLISDNRFKNDALISVIVMIVPTILYLIPYIYGTIKFHKED